MHLEPAAFAARQFRVAHELIDQQTQAFPERIFRVSYEEFCAETAPTTKRLTDWCGLRWAQAFEASLPANLEARNDKWKSVLGVEQVDKLLDDEGPTLAR